MTALLLINLLLVAVAVAFVIIAVARPAALTASIGPAVPPGSVGRFYLCMYAARGLPLGIVIIVRILQELHQRPM